MKNTWSIEKYKAYRIEEMISNKEIEVPEYQRGAVWSKSKKEKLIESIKRGIPFGAILLYKKTDVKKYSLIDGLQRCKTINDFMRNPTQFFNSSDIDENILNEIITLTGYVNANDNMKKKIVTQIIDWLQDTYPTMKDIKKLQYSDCARMLSIHYPTLNTVDKKDQLTDIIAPIFQEFMEICDYMSDVEIPAIVIEGDDSILPEVFERINSEGAKLTKQQVYAATWSNYSVRITDKELQDILESNRERYDNMQDEGIEVENYDSRKFGENKQINIFEMVFGFGKKISKDFPSLFEYDGDPMKVESIGFNLINACLCKHNNEIKNTHINLRKVFQTDEEISRFLLRIIECIKYVDRKLKRITAFKGNSRKEERNDVFHTELQITSIIADVFIKRHVEMVIDQKESVMALNVHLDRTSLKWENVKNSFDKNMVKVYIIDILLQRWKGAGDRRLDNIIFSNVNYYTRAVDWDELEQSLNTWFEMLNSERNEYVKVSQPKEAEKVILNLIYSEIFRAKDQLNDTKYDIEHLAPKAQMKKLLERFKGNLRLPISSIGNLCYLLESDNRTKRDKTIYQDENYLRKVNLKLVEDSFTFTKKEDLEWIEKQYNSEKALRDKYIEFVNNRFSKMKEYIKSSLYNER